MAEVDWDLVTFGLDRLYQVWVHALAERERARLGPEPWRARLLDDYISAVKRAIRVAQTLEDLAAAELVDALLECGAGETLEEALRRLGVFDTLRTPPQPAPTNP